MKYLLFCFNAFLLGVLIASIISCCTIHVSNHLHRRLTPQYHGVDPVLQKYVDDYMNLAKDKNIKFTNSVSVGFMKINAGQVIGVCNYGRTFREIDIDQNFWDEATNTQKEALMRHELSHCYCNRDHDWAEGKTYPEPSHSDRKNDIFNVTLFTPNHEGMYEDNCPLSLMYPILPSDSCVWSHYQDYSNEIFQRCEPY